MSFADRRYGRGDGFGGPVRAFGDRPRGTWWIIGVTAVATVLVWLISGGATAQSMRLGFELRQDALMRFQIWRFATYMLLHGSPGHLFWNMLMVFFVGQFLEGNVGTRTLVAMYVAFGVVAGLGYTLDPTVGLDPLEPTRSIPCVGASGAAMGLVAFLGSRFPRVRFMIWGIIPMTGWALAAILVGLDVLAVIANPGGDGSAHSVHLAGAFAGFAYGFLWPRLSVVLDERRAAAQRARRTKEREREQKDGLELDRILAKIREEGMDSLTPKERQFLLDQSEKLKGRR